ncbi:MAG: MBL fold metallo-hydrolase [Pseudomonadales bacterium]|jgi:cyclase|tara:strand:+ start:9105 stop:9959 length:855 start_codon:yes stop_codon:yes gene_type:complete
MKTLITALLLCVTSIATNVFAEDRFAKVEIRTEQISENIYVLFGTGGNIGVLNGPDGILMIDDQFAPLADKIRAALDKLGGTTPTYVLNTHYHGDHTGSNAVFGQNSIIMAHDNVRMRLLAGGTKDSALPVITFATQATIYFNNQEAHLIHMPAGHTDGDAIVYFPNENVIHLGDHFFKDRFPYVDLQAGGTVNGLIDNIVNILSRVDSDTKIIPGHGEMATKVDLQRYLNMLTSTRQFIDAELAQGKSEKSILAAGLAPKWDSWGEGFINEERWLKTLISAQK